MRKIVCISFFIVLSAVCHAQPARLLVGVDERIELLTTVQLLSGYKWLTQADLTYKKEILTAFDKYKDHEAVAYYRAISPRFYGYEPLLLLCHYELPEFKQTAAFTVQDFKELRLDKLGDTLQVFISLLKDFHVSSGFHKFFIAHKPYYDSIAIPIRQEAEKYGYVDTIEAHFGTRNVGYHAILSPLQMDAGFGPMVVTKEGNVLYAITGPAYNSGLFPIFDKDALFKELVIHEFCHSFCNTLIDSFYDELEKDSSLLKPILKSQREQGYGEWKTCLYEHLTRANEIVLNGKLYGEAIAEEIYKKQVEEDEWIYLVGLLPLIREYSARREQYANQYALMPKVVAYFHEQREKNIKENK